MTMVTQSASVVAYKPKTISKSTILSEDKKMSLFVGAYYLVNTLNLSLKIVFPISEFLWRILSVGFAALLAGLMLFTIKPVLKRSFKSFFIAETIFVALYCISFFQGNADLSFLVETAFWTLGVCIPLAFYVHSVSHKNILYETLLKYSYFLIAILSWVSFTMLSDRGGSGSYNMSLSYALALPVILQFNEFIEKQRVLNLVVTVIGILGILLYGARGPLVCVAAFSLLKYLIISKTLLDKI